MQAEERRLVEHADVHVDESGAVVDKRAGGRAARLLEGLAPGANVFAYLHPEDADIARWMVARTLGEPGRTATVELRWPRRADHWSKLQTAFASAGASRVRLRLRYDEIATLKRAEEQMRRVVEGSAQGIIVRSRSEVLYMNDSFAHLLGYADRHECMAEYDTADGSIHPDDLPLVLKHLEARLRGEEAVSNYEFRLVHRDGSIIWVETYSANVDWDGRAASLSWISDISKRKAIEEESLRSKLAAEFANRTKTQFLANMSHELRTPLNAILGFSEVIERQLFGPIPAKYLDYAGDIHRSGRHLLELVNDVLDLSKLEAGKLELHESEVCIREAVDECVALLRDRAVEGKVRLHFDLPQDLPRLRADARAVRQLLLNFLSNAVKFTPEGGEVEVTAETDRAGGLVLAVRDTGIGMTPAEIEVALSPFGQIDSQLARKHEGTGLGLPICRSLLELHGGALSVTSEPNVGTVLTARFPPARVLAAGPAIRSSRAP